MDLLRLVEGVGGGLYMTVITVVGGRLLFLARRNRAMPELLLGLAFLLGGTIGGTCEVIGRRMPGIDPATGGTFLLMGKIFAGLSLNIYNFFIWRIFRPKVGWARALFLLLLATTLLSLFGQLFEGAFQNAHTYGRFFWVEFATRMASPVWLVVESFRYAGLMRRRVGLGLADPVVADRFRLWGLGASCSVLTLLTTLCPAFFPPEHPLNSVNIAVLGATGILSCVCYWLTFFPSQAYLARIRVKSGALPSA